MTEMVLQRLLILWAAFSFSATVSGAEIFSPADCDFSVTFPNKYETREIYAPSGQSTVLAKSPSGQPVKLSAECWPLQVITPQEYAKSLSPKMTERGVQVLSVNLAKGNYGDIVTLAGTAGQGADKYHIRFESFFGPKTRLDLLVLEKSSVASKEHLAFRNSVKIK